jgi:hypothetical protein
LISSQGIWLYKEAEVNNQKGFVLIAGLLVVLLLTVLMVCGMTMAVGNLRGTSNDREAKKTFYLAEAGVEEAKGRMHPDSPNNIPDIVGQPIYVIDSMAHPPSGARKRVRIEATRVPLISSLAALYTKQPTTIMGTSTFINGNDSCGGTSVPGVLTMNTLTIPGDPVIQGNPPIADNSLIDLQISGIIDQLKPFITQTIPVGSSNPTLTGMAWGNPIPGADSHQASSCADAYTRVTYVDGSVKLAGGSQGCGVLMVNGNLEINGGFQWYGIILVAGSLRFAGGGERNVTGSILAGDTSAIDVVGGNTAIVYCGNAVNLQTNRVPLVVLKWEEVWG